MPHPSTILRSYAVIQNTEIAEGIVEVTFEPVHPEDAIPAFEAGQWVSVHMLNPDGSTWGKRSYSIACAPSDLTDARRIPIAVKRAGEGSERIHHMKPGDRVHLQGPFGVFTLRKNGLRSVFFAGGIGVTPIRSMIREATALDPNQAMTLFYSCRTDAGCAYAEEFRALAAAHQESFRYITQAPCVADPNDPACFGEIDAALLDTAIGSYEDTEFYCCGPRPFMDKIESFIRSKGVVNDRFHREQFG